MKRVIAAVVLLIIVVAGCLYSYTTEREHFEAMVSLAERAEECYRDGDTEGAQREAEALSAVFGERMKRMSLFLPHNALTEAEKSIQGLTLILPYGEPKDFTAEARRCRLLLQRLWDQEQPTWENVF